MTEAEAMAAAFAITDLQPYYTIAEPEWNEDSATWEIGVWHHTSVYILRTPAEVRAWLHDHISKLVPLMSA